MGDGAVASVGPGRASPVGSARRTSALTGSIGAYCPILRAERAIALIDSMLARGQRVFLPHVEQHTPQMHFAPWNGDPRRLKTNHFGIAEPMDQLLWLTALTILIWVFESLFEYLYALKWRGLAQDLQHELRQAAYAHLQKLPPDYIARERSGKLMALMNEDVNQIERFLNTGANDLIQVFCSSLMVGAVFFVITADLAVLALLPIPLILFGAFWFQRRLYPRYVAARDAAAVVSNRLNNNLAGMATIQAYTAEDFEREHVRAASEIGRAHV
mgnify:CR=1 FL=1